MITLILTLFLSYSSAKPLPNPPQSDPALIGWSGLIGTAAPNLIDVPYDRYTENLREFVLDDGSLMGGLLFMQDAQGLTPRPLIIANFGSLSDRWSSAGSAFIRGVVLANKLRANVLVVDSISGAGFYSLNESLSLGGYDEGRALVQLAKAISADKTIPHTTLHLLGVSLGGAAVMHALVEDQRLGTDLFKSAISFSGVTHHDELTDCVLNMFNYSLKNSSGCKLSWTGNQIIKSALKHYKATLRSEVMLKLKAEDKILSSNNAGQRFYNLFHARLSAQTTKNIKSRTLENLFPWNPEVETESVESYLKTSSVIFLKNINKLKVPLIVIHAKNDPIVPYAHYKRFVDVTSSSEFVMTHRTRFGGHWGYIASHGTDWVAELVNRILPAK
ncbi:MAG: hypothetical protein SGI74_13795 [Oligoflexia bacterium]|nr:hypothetical protein [Oligoflexia bacterium]